jgi:hypothetical protein
MLPRRNASKAFSSSWTRARNALFRTSDDRLFGVLAARLLFCMKLSLYGIAVRAKNENCDPNYLIATTRTAAGDYSIPQAAALQSGLSIPG